MRDAPADDLPLAAEFPAATYAQWRQLAERVLKGARFEERLESRTSDGLTIEPLYPRAREARHVAGRHPGARWQILQRIDHPDPAAANAQALHELEHGASGLVLVAAGSVGAHGYGITMSPSAIECVLDGIQLDASLSLELDLAPDSTATAATVHSLLERRGIAPQATDIRFGTDLVGTGLWRPPEAIAKLREDLLSRFSFMGFKAALAADGRIVHAAGGTEAQELAFVLANAVAFLRMFEPMIGLAETRDLLFFRLAADTDQFVTIAKFRALRKLWARVEEACGLAPKPAFVRAETAWRMMTKRNPWTNVVRTTIAAFAAAAGGADAITVLPFTLALGLPDQFARRIARNTQLVLLDEAALARVADPVTGTGWGEDLTDRLCRSAWTLFQEIEAAGGATAALERGLIQAKVKAARAARERAVATRHDALVGVNEFPHLDEAPVSVLDAAPIAAPSPRAGIEPMPPIRLAAPFEALRDLSDRRRAATGARPRIFVAHLGSPADFAARSTFARNFFAAGGIEAVGDDASASRDEMIAAFKSSGAKLACLCSSDRVYAREAVEAAQALNAAGARHLYLVGRPGSSETTFKQAGIETFIHAGCDALAILQSANQRCE